MHPSQQQQGFPGSGMRTPPAVPLTPALARLKHELIELLRQARLQPCVVEAATPSSGGCNPM